MVPNQLFYQLLMVALILICLLIHVGLPDKPLPMLQPPLAPHKRRRKRSKEPQPFPGLLHKPLCEACAQGADVHSKAPGSPPPIIRFTRGRRRTVDTHSHFCPDPACSYHGWCGRGNIRANGLPTICQAEFVTFHRIAWWSVSGTHRKPPEVRICRLSIQSGVGTRPPSTSTPHWPAC
jgi:hypothetical protein